MEYGASAGPCECFWCMSLTCTLQYWGQLDIIPGIHSEVMMKTYFIVVSLVECSPLLHTENSVTTWSCTASGLAAGQSGACHLSPVALTMFSNHILLSNLPYTWVGTSPSEHKLSNHCPVHSSHNEDSYSWLLQTEASGQIDYVYVCMAQLVSLRLMAFSENRVSLQHPWWYLQSDLTIFLNNTSHLNAQVAFLDTLKTDPFLLFPP